MANDITLQYEIIKFKLHANTSFFLFRIKNDLIGLLQVSSGTSIFTANFFY
jgi:hypothetical protein